jgi:hypothetical protein
MTILIKYFGFLCSHNFIGVEFRNWVICVLATPSIFALISPQASCQIRTHLGSQLDQNGSIPVHVNAVRWTFHGARMPICAGYAGPSNSTVEFQYFDCVSKRMKNNTTCSDIKPNTDQNVKFHSPYIGRCRSHNGLKLSASLCML